MPENTDKGARTEPPVWAYAIASALLWAVVWPLTEWVTGDILHVGSSAMKGAVMGLVWGLGMFAFGRWLRRCRPRPGAPSSGGAGSESPKPPGG